MRNLREIVIDYMVEKGIESIDRHYMRYYRLAVNGLRETVRETSNQDWYKKHVKIQKNAAGVFPMPEDYQDYVFVGVCSGGYMMHFTYRDDICPPMVDDCGDLMPKGTARWFSSTHWGSTSFNNFKGSSNSFSGFFKPFFDQGYFVVEGGESGAVDEIILVYRSSMYEKDGDYMVFPNDEMVIKAYISWRLMDADENAPVSQKQWAFRTYVNRKTHARRLNNPFKIQDILDAVNK